MSDFDQVSTAADAQAAAAPVEGAPAPVETSAEVNQQVPSPLSHESVLRRLMDRLEAVGQGLDSELSHWMQKAREIL